MERRLVVQRWHHRVCYACDLPGQIKPLVQMMGGARSGGYELGREHPDTR